VQRFITRIRRFDAGQTTAEYALVLLGAVAIASLLLAWAGKTNVVTDLMDTVFSKIGNLVK
jgi:Flp pilus assembly pilin Flp